MEGSVGWDATSWINKRIGIRISLFAKRKWVVLSMLAALGLMLVGVGARAGGKPNAVEFTFAMGLTGPGSAAGTFELSGAMTDLGNASETFRFASSGSVAHGETLIEGQNRTIIMQFHVHITPGDEPGVMCARGGWVIKSGDRRL